MTPTVWRSSSASSRWLHLGVLTALIASLLMAAALSPSRADAAEEPAPFTFVVLPDTQGYTASSTYQSIMGEQTRWIRDQRAAMNTAFVAQVGDLVESHPSDPMWQRASTHMSVLDDAGVPNSVLPGNHDMNVSTGEAPKFDTYFPPSRYAQNTWTPSTSRYGGYLGQNLYGTDPVDRGNKDSFSLFSAGGMDFLVLSLEYEAPDYALAWAQKVIDNNPDRRIILSTHSLVDASSQRGWWTTRTDPGINSAPQVWDKLIFPNCNIFMVVNGHWRSNADPTQGEARRTDPNACGTPVHQMLSNYQGRPNGGDGWLRYYTFDPSKNTISAKTYSPHLGAFETDADSQFSLAYPMGGAAPDTVITHSAAGADWRYRFEASAPATTWTSNGYNASSWKKGQAPLGFGTWGPKTNIDLPAGTKRPVAAQFRHYVNITNAAGLVDPKVTVIADDGVIVYINGKEVGRANLPTGTVTWSTYALASRRHSTAVAEPLTFTIPAGLLKNGTNTIAAQVSSNYRATPDMTLEVTLTSTAP